MSLEKAMLGLS